MFYLGELLVLGVLTLIIIIWGTRKEEDILSVTMSNEMKGLAILLIFLVHSYSEPSLFAKYGGFGVGIFLFLSGYGLYQSRKLDSIHPIPYFQKRCLKLFPALLVYLAIVILFWIFSPGIASPVITGQVPGNFISFIYANFAYSPLWFIPFIIFWYIVYYLVSTVRIDDSKKITMLFLVGFLIVVLRPFEGSFWRMIYEWFVYALCFPSGVLVSYHIAEVRKFLLSGIFSSLWAKALSCLAVFALISLIILASKILPYNTIHYPLTSVMFVFGTLMVFAFFLREYRSRFLCILGNVSYEIYLFHSLFIVLILELSRKFLFDSFFIRLFATLFATLLFSLLLKKAIYALLPKVYVLFKTPAGKQ